MLRTRACNLSGDLVQAPPFDPSDILLEDTRQAAVCFLDAVHLVLQDRDAVLLCNAMHRNRKQATGKMREIFDTRSPEAPMTRTTRGTGL